MQLAAQGLDAHRLAARIQHTAHQREQIVGDHAQHEMERVGIEVAAPAGAGCQRPVDVAALRAVELELLLAGFSKPLHHHRERFGRAVHRVQEARRLLRLAERAVALDMGCHCDSSRPRSARPRSRRAWRRLRSRYPGS